MRQETHEITWYTQDEPPQRDGADVLAHVTEFRTKEGLFTTPTFFKLLKWFNKSHGLESGFYEDGHLINDSTYFPCQIRYLKFDWCYLTDLEQGKQIEKETTD